MGVSVKYIYDDREFVLEVSLISDALFEKSIETKLLYLLEGQAEIHIDDNIYELKKEDMLVINRDSSYTLQPHGSILLCSLTIYYEMLKEFLNQDYVVFECNSVGGKADGYPVIQEKLKSILNLVIFMREGKKDIRITSLFYQIMEYMFQYFLFINNDKELLKNDDSRKKQIAYYVEGNYQNHISLKELADELFLTYHYLSRNFKYMFGIGFNDYVNNVRLRHVIKDLFYTKKNITEIAIDNGFTSSPILNRVFKNTYHMTPTEYIKYIRNNKKKDDPDKEKELLQLKVQQLLLGEKPANFDSSQQMSNLISINVSNYKRCRKVFNRMINIGFAPDLLFAGLQEHILVLCEELGFRYIRLWNIFHEKMNFWNGRDIKNLNYERLDQLFDFMMEHQIKPFIEFGNKPKIIIKTVSLDDQRGTEPAYSNQYLTMESFCNILGAFMDHIIDRYGSDEVTTWQYEFWNEFILPVSIWENKNIEFFDVFDNAYEIIKTRLPHAQVGGSGMPVNFDLKNFYHIWTKHKKPDFVSVMMYPYRGGYKNCVYETEIDYFERSVDYVRDSLKAADINCMLYVTEWNSTLSSRHYQNDSCYQAAYCVKNAIDIMDKVDLVGFWVGSDRFTSAYDAYQPINGGSGLLTKDGIRKPAFFAFQFMNNLDLYRITSTENAVITTDLRGNYTVLCHNFHNMDIKYYMLPEIQWSVEQYLAYEKNGEQQLLGFQLEGVAPGNYKVAAYEMGPTKGSILEEWRKLDLATKLSNEEIKYLKNTCAPRLSSYKVHVKEDEIFKYELKLELQEIVLLKINKI